MKYCTLTFKDKKLLKSSAAKKYLKYFENAVNKVMTANREKFEEAFIMGYPIKFYSNGRIEVIKNIYKTTRKLPETAAMQILNAKEK